MIWRFVPLGGVTLLFIVACVVRPLLQLRRHGSFGIVLFGSRSFGPNIRDLCVIGFALFVAAQAIVAAVWPRTLRPLVTEPTASLLLHSIGAIVFFGGITVVVIAQLHLGASWRIGIDEGARPGLVTAGLYRYSRNPIYLGLLIAIAGYTALLPTVLSVMLLLGIYIGIRAQIAAEEAYLLRTYGDLFRNYARHVGRFVPGIGRLRDSPGQARGLSNGPI